MGYCSAMQLAIALAALALSIASLIWQVWTWQRSRHRVVITRTGDHVTVRNLGRSAVNVDSVQFIDADHIVWPETNIRGHKQFVVRPYLFERGPQLPHRLEPQSSATWQLGVYNPYVSTSDDPIDVPPDLELPKKQRKRLEARASGWPHHWECIATLATGERFHVKSQ